MSQQRPYSFNGANFPKAVWASCLLEAEFLDQYRNGIQDEGSIFNCPGIISANLRIENAMRYCRTDFVYKEKLNEGKPNECEKTNEDEEVIKQEKFIRCMFKIYLSSSNEKHGISSSCMLLDNKSVHLNP